LAITVSARTQSDIAVLDVQGSLTLGPALGSLREAAQKAITPPAKAEGLIISVSGVNLIDSSGLGELTLVYTICSKRNCPLRLVGVSPSLKRMLEMTRIDELLPSCNSLEEAIRSIKPAKRF
jgi:anti-anti-sigma factor